MCFPYPRPLTNEVHPHPNRLRTTAISTLHICPLAPPQETIRQYNVLHGRFEPIHGYRKTYACVGIWCFHYGRINAHVPPISVQKGLYRIYGIDGDFHLYASHYYAIIGRGRRADLVWLTSIYNEEDRRDLDKDFYYDDDNFEHDFDEKRGLFPMM